MICIRTCTRCGTKIQCPTFESWKNRRFCDNCKSKRVKDYRDGYYSKMRDVLKRKRIERYQKEKLQEKEIEVKQKGIKNE